MQGTRQLAITQQQAWDALNDPVILKACIPGCDKFESTDENQYAVGMALKVGPVSAKFAGKIALSDMVAPTSYTLKFEGQGGAAGFGKGASSVQLVANDAGCELKFTVNATVGGKVAQLGQRLIDGAAKSMAEDFFKRFDEAMQKAYPDAYAARDALTAASPTSGESTDRPHIPLWVWIAATGAFIVGIWILRNFG